jgi:hypothetical protein
VKKLFAAWTLAEVMFAPSLAVIDSDTFTDTNGTDLDAHDTDVGTQPWVQLGTCVMGISGNKAVWELTSGWCGATVDSSDADVAVEVDIAIPNASDYAYGLFVRFVDGNNYWRVFFYRNSGGTPALNIDENNASTETNRDTDNLGAVSGTTKNLKVTLSGNTINAYVDDVLTSTYTSASHNTATKHGLMIYSGFDTSGTFDNYSVDSDPSGGGAASFIPGIINTPVRGGGLRAFFRY